MASKSSASELTRLITQLRQERQHHLDSIAEIDQTFTEFGITAGGPRATRGPGKRKKAVKKAVLKGKPGRRKAKRGRKPAAAEATTTTTRKGPGKRKKAAVKKGPGRKGKRRAAGSSGGDKKPRSPWGSKFPMTGDELILTFIKDKGNATTEEIRNHWLTSGRKGKAENNLTNLVKSGKLKRAKIDGQLGSSYSIV